MTRQNYYKERKKRMRKRVDENLFVELVSQERALQPRLGCRKVMSLLKEKLEENSVSIGRDRAFDILRKKDMLIKRKKAFIPKTTNSYHSLPVFKNLVKSIDITSPNQVWVADLTYIRTEQDFVYAYLVTDAYSRKIVGHHISYDLRAEGSLKVLKKAMEKLPENCTPIHHSDRGIQYCCHDFVNTAREAGIKISMTEEQHCYENAIAERVNGILKQEYGLDHTFKTKEQVHEIFDQAVNLYNTRRPHQSLNYKIPDQVYRQEVA